MTYIVNGMTLIPQQLTDSCWYASARMVIKWREDKSRMSHAGLIDPVFDAQCQRVRDANNGITNVGLVNMAERLGLRKVPPMTPTPNAVESWLRMYGPLWVNGARHITVVAGIKPGLNGDHMFLVYDPLPQRAGKIEWRSWMQWYEGNAWSGRDSSNAAQVIFLHCPQF